MATDAAREKEERRTALRKLQRSTVVQLDGVAKDHGMDALGTTPHPYHNKIDAHRQKLLNFLKEDEAASKRIDDIWESHTKAAAALAAPPEATTEAGKDGAAKESGEKKKKYEMRGLCHMMTFHGLFLTLALFADFVAWIKRSIHSWGVKYWSATAEECPKTAGRIHYHLFLQFYKAIEWTSNECLWFTTAFGTSKPNVQDNYLATIDNIQYNKKNARGAINRSILGGHFYVVMDKIGSLASETNFHPWVDYSPDSRRLDGWLQQGKLTREMWLYYRSKCVTGFSHALADFDAVVKFENRKREADMEAFIESTRKRVMANPSIFVRYPPVAAVENWKELFPKDPSDTTKDRARYPFLVIIGQSGLGKTDWAVSLFKKPFVLRIGKTTQWPSHFRSYDFFENDAIILDDVRDAQFLCDFQHILQGKWNDAETFGLPRMLYSLRCGM